jgi:hypothetical protein
MRNGTSEPGPAPSAGATGAETTQTIKGQAPGGGARADGPAGPPARAATEVASTDPATDVVRHGPGVPGTVTAGQFRHARQDSPRTGQPPEILRYGPGVPAALPAGQPELTAERAWRPGGRGKPSRRRPRLSRLAGLALTACLLAASGVLLYERIHHAPFHVTGVAITQQAQNGCGTDVTGRITTNGSAGAVSYQWLVEPSQQPPQPLSQSVLAGQQAVYVTIAVEGAGQGSTAQTVTLQVLGPDTRAASAAVTVSCH